MAAGDGAVVELEVLHSSCYPAKDGFIRAVGVTDADAADGVALAVESARERMRRISYGRIVVIHRLVVGDVSAQFEVGAGEGVGGIAIGTVHLLGEQVEACGGVDDVRVFLSTIAAPRVLAIELAIVNQTVLVGGDALVVGAGGVGAARCAHCGVGFRKFVGDGGAVHIAAGGIVFISYAAHAAAGVVVVVQDGFVTIVLANDGADMIT